jgi:hypothetical protein
MCHVAVQLTVCSYPAVCGSDYCLQPAGQSVVGSLQPDFHIPSTFVTVKRIVDPVQVKSYQQNVVCFIFIRVFYSANLTAFSPSN